MIDKVNSDPTRFEAFVSDVFRRKKLDNAFAAHLRRADNPATESGAWGILTQLGVNITIDNDRLPFALIGSAIARTETEVDGHEGFGAALAGCFNDESDGSPASSRMRRLVACDSTIEACRVLRPMLRLINSRSDKRSSLSFQRLLGQISFFQYPERRKRIRLEWASGYYRSTSTANVGHK